MNIHQAQPDSPHHPTPAFRTDGTTHHSALSDGKSEAEFAHNLSETFFTTQFSVTYQLTCALFCLAHPHPHSVNPSPLFEVVSRLSKGVFTLGRMSDAEELFTFLLSQIDEELRCFLTSETYNSYVERARDLIEAAFISHITEAESSESTTPPLLSRQLTWGSNTETTSRFLKYFSPKFLKNEHRSDLAIRTYPFSVQRAIQSDHLLCFDSESPSPTFRPFRPTRTFELLNPVQQTFNGVIVREHQCGHCGHILTRSDISRVINIHFKDDDKPLPSEKPLVGDLISDVTETQLISSPPSPTSSPEPLPLSLSQTLFRSESDLPPVQLESLLSDSFRPSQAEFKCERCSYMKGVSSTSLAVLPRVIVLSVNRFKFEDDRTKKIMIPVVIPSELNFSPYARPSTLTPTASLSLPQLPGLLSTAWKRGLSERHSDFRTLRDLGQDFLRTHTTDVLPTLSLNGEVATDEPILTLSLGQLVQYTHALGFSSCPRVKGQSTSPDTQTRILIEKLQKEDAEQAALERAFEAAVGQADIEANNEIITLFGEHFMAFKEDHHYFGMNPQRDTEFLKYLRGKSPFREGNAPIPEWAARKEIYSTYGADWETKSPDSPLFRTKSPSSIRITNDHDLEEFIDDEEANTSNWNHELIKASRADIDTFYTDSSPSLRNWRAHDPRAEHALHYGSQNRHIHANHPHTFHRQQNYLSRTTREDNQEVTPKNNDLLPIHKQKRESSTQLTPPRVAEQSQDDSPPLAFSMKVNERIRKLNNKLQGGSGGTSKMSLPDEEDEDLSQSLFDLQRSHPSPHSSPPPISLLDEPQSSGDGSPREPDQVQFERFVITSKQLAFGVEEAKHKYYLRSLIVHKGDSVSHGHYEAYSQLPNSHQWIHCNDARTQTMNRDEVLAKPEVQKNCYLLFYVHQDSL
ncbi:putative Ubiquitin carboxyl-terminal hydrolase [Blattamonas nauphoetae]|uniref:Ubiquitin carboxyl-terminal hydrolase n=1 Tax=Blattamonas nauphoetae TaxID=2049346 RepID=A0ABQ9XQE5_9EUKA|nr:putative Ubiquitin carboxyl-terminal hydrolase [Blattamonas nauphoetae]